MAVHQEPAYDGKGGNSTQYKVPSDLTSLFFPSWALKQTLEAELFRALFTEVELELQPQNVFDMMEAAEITHCFFQQQQVQRSFRDIVRSARCTALVTIIAPLLGHDFDRAGDLASQYFSGDAEKRRSVVQLLHAHGLDDNSVDAMAMGQRALLLPPLNRMAAALGIRKDELVEAARGRKAARAMSAGLLN